MARITVEDCIDKFPSRFELVLVASNRARKLHSGETPTVDKDNDKNTVIALREIASETLSSADLKEDLIEEYQTTTFSEDEEINEIEDDSNNEDSTNENYVNTDVNKSSDVNETDNKDNELSLLPENEDNINNINNEGEDIKNDDADIEVSSNTNQT